MPRDVYDTEEKAQMRPPPTAPFDVPLWSTAKVHSDHHVQVQKALYSVPTRYIGKVVEVRADRSSVRLYLGAALVKVHTRTAWSALDRPKRLSAGQGRLGAARC